MGTPIARISSTRSMQYLCVLFYPASKRSFHGHMKARAFHALRKPTLDSQRSVLKNGASWKTTDWKIKTRSFWGLEVAFNKVDEERVKLAGPDRAAAEWILRNEGSLKWKNSEKYLKNYNFLPSTDFESYKIEKIDLTATNVIGLGFEHLENLKHVNSIVLHGCRTIRDDALGHLHFVQDTLEYLDVSRCPMITEKGLQQLHCLRNLKTLVVYDLIEIKKFDEVISRLAQTMSWCKINTDDPLEKNDPEEIK